MILYVSATNFENVAKSGGEQLCKSHYNSLVKIYGKENILKLVPDNGVDSDNTIYLGRTKNKVSTFVSNINGYLCGYNKTAERKLLKYVNKDIEKIFFDYSCYGTAQKKIKKNFPKIKIITFFHNVESEFQKKVFKRNRIYFFTYKAALNQERLSIKYSDVNICLNKRDYDIIKVKYGRECDYIMPIYVKDNYFNYNRNNCNDNFLLFVGVGTYRPNYDGIKWFIDNVMPNVKQKLKIVGKDFEKYKDELERDNVEVIGTVDDIGEYYFNASIVVLPILYGDGMKVKTCEALMYGKNILGTKEALEGYCINEKIGIQCNNKLDFIQGINKLFSWDKYNSYSRELYLNLYSEKVNDDLLKKIMKG